MIIKSPVQTVRNDKGQACTVRGQNKHHGADVPPKKEPVLTQASRKSGVGNVSTLSKGPWVVVLLSVGLGCGDRIRVVEGTQGQLIP